MVEATTYLPFLCDKSATTCQIDLKKVPNSKLKPDLCNCAKTEMIESKAPPQQSHKRAHFLVHPVLIYESNTVQSDTFPFKAQNRCFAVV